jgi:MFS family permease
MTPLSVTARTPAARMLPDRPKAGIAGSRAPTSQPNRRGPQGRHLRWRPTAPGRSRGVSQRSGAALYATVLLPFAAGYYLSWVYYTISALIADQLARELALSPLELGIVTASYLLGMAVVQIPLGGLTDRRGPRWVQTICCLIASGGAVVFAIANSLPMLLAGRVLLGIGTATAFTAGVNAIALWFPAQRAAFATGLFVMLGSLGAVTATLPAQVLVDIFGWRPVLVLLGLSSVLCAALTYIVVPDKGIDWSNEQLTDDLGISAILADRRFWKLAPVSATCIGTAWSLQSLWAAPRLSKVDGLDQISIAHALFAMAIALSLSSLVFGALAGRFQRTGIGLETLFGLILLLFLVAQLAVLLRLSIPVVVPWIVIAAVGSATVVGYAILATYVPKHSLGRANAAFNLIHLLVAFAVQTLIGVVIDLSPDSGGARQPVAYQTALTIVVAIEGIAFAWFAIPADWVLKRRRTAWPKVFTSHPGWTEESRYFAARQDWNRRLIDADVQLRAWRMAALATMTVLFVLATLVVPLDAVQSLASLPNWSPVQRVDSFW